MARGGGRRAGRPLEGRLVISFEGLFVAGIGGSHPLRNPERREERLREEEPGARAAPTPRSEWQDPSLEPDGYCGDALFANFESGFGGLPSFSKPLYKTDLRSV